MRMIHLLSLYSIIHPRLTSLPDRCVCLLFQPFHLIVQLPRRCALQRFGCTELIRMVSCLAPLFIIQHEFSLSYLDEGRIIFHLTYHVCYVSHFLSLLELDHRVIAEAEFVREETRIHLGPCLILVSVCFFLQD